MSKISELKELAEAKKKITAEYKQVKDELKRTKEEERRITTDLKESKRDLMKGKKELRRHLNNLTMNFFRESADDIEVCDDLIPDLEATCEYFLLDLDKYRKARHELEEL